MAHNERPSSPRLSVRPARGVAEVAGRRRESALECREAYVASGSLVGEEGGDLPVIYLTRPTLALGLHPNRSAPAHPGPGIPRALPLFMLQRVVFQFLVPVRGLACHRTRVP